MDDKKGVPGHGPVILHVHGSFSIILGKRCKGATLSGSAADKNSRPGHTPCPTAGSWRKRPEGRWNCPIGGEVTPQASKDSSFLKQVKKIEKYGKNGKKWEKPAKYIDFYFSSWFCCGSVRRSSVECEAIWSSPSSFVGARDHRFDMMNFDGRFGLSDPWSRLDFGQSGKEKPSPNTSKKRPLRIPGEPWWGRSHAFIIPPFRSDFYA